MSAGAENAIVALRTLLIGAAGGWIFAWFQMPVPWLAGPMVSVAIATMAGVPVLLPAALRDFGLLVAGVSMGSTITPEAVGAVTRYPLSIAGLGISLVLTVLVSRTILERAFGWDRPTAFLSSVPGALSMVMALAATNAADMRRVAIAQAIRLFVLVAVLPWALVASAEISPPVSLPIVGAGSMALLFAAAYAGNYLLARSGSANPLFLGGMIVAALLHVSDAISGALPDPVVGLGFLLVGIFCGIRFEGATPRLLAETLLPSAAALAATLSVAFVSALIVHRVTGLKLPEVLVAFAPGGVEAMILMGASLGLDTLYISTHHVVRTLALNLLTPAVAPGRDRG